MKFQVFEPSPDIRAWVSAGMHVALDSPGPHPVACRFPALVEGGIVLVLEGKFLATSPSGGFAALPAGFVSSARALPLTLYRTPRLRCVGLQLQPAGTQALLGSSPSSLPHQLADAADVFGRSWDDLIDRIGSGRSPARAVALLLGFARAHLRRDVHAQRVQRAMMLQQAALRPAGPNDNAGLGRRQFERVFTGTFGLRPKLFQRVARVEGVLRDALVSGRTDAGIALRHGYYDQSHLARDLRALAGAPLRTLVEAVRRRDAEHWALAVGTSRRPIGT